MKSREERTAQAAANRAKNKELVAQCSKRGDSVRVAKLMQKVMSTVMAKARRRVKCRADHALNKERDNAATKRWAQRNPERIYQKQKIYKERIRPELAKKEREKYHTDELFALKSRVRARLRHFLKKNAIDKDVETFGMIGCSPGELRDHLQSQLPDGSSLSDFQVDHIFPLNMYTAEEKFKMTNYHNLQPLTAFENNRKHDKFPTKLMASKVPVSFWPANVSMDDLPERYD